MNNKGFSLIGVMVASVIGLIVVAGVSQLFINMSSQMRQIENKSKQTMLQDQLWGVLKQGCTNTFDYAKEHIFKGDGINRGNSDVNFKKLHKIKDELDGVFLNLDSGSTPNDIDRVQRVYNLAEDGALHFVLKCKEADCDCRSQTPNPPTSSDPCKKSWELSFISHSKIQDVLVYNKPISFNINTVFNRKWNQAPPNPSDPETFSCNVESAAGSSGVPPNQTCPAASFLTGFDINGNIICNKPKGSDILDLFQVVGSPGMRIHPQYKSVSQRTLSCPGSSFPIQCTAYPPAGSPICGTKINKLTRSCTINACSNLSQRYFVSLFCLEEKP